MKIMILANTDPTSSMIFKKITNDVRLEIVCVAFTETLTSKKSFFHGLIDIYRRTGFPYFRYICFWNSVFLFKEKLLSLFPALKKILSGYFSLRLWAQENNILVIDSHNFNSPEFLEKIRQFSPDVLFTRINQILKQPILEIAPYGCWCFHSSELPKFQGIAAEFHSLVYDEQIVGLTVMKMELKLDSGPIIAQNTTPIPESITLHSLIRLNSDFSHGVIDKSIEGLLEDKLTYLPQDPARKSYFSWPTPERTKIFKQKKYRYITFREAIQYIFE